MEQVDKVSDNNINGALHRKVLILLEQKRHPTQGKKESHEISLLA